MWRLIFVNAILETVTYDKNMRKYSVFFTVTFEIEIGPVTFYLSVVLVHSDIHFSVIIVFQHRQHIFHK